MSMTEERKSYLYKYQKEKLKRVPLDFQRPEYERVQAAAVAAGASVSGYIKSAIAEKIERDGI